MGKITGLKKFSEDDLGLVGIGTLIIFIALILVAAVAAGVIIRTSGELREQARSTGEEAIRQVSTGVQVVGVKGRVKEDHVENVAIMVKLRAGSRGVSFNSTIVQYLSPNMSTHLSLGFENKEVQENALAFDSKEALEEHWSYLDNDEFAVLKLRTPGQETLTADNTSLKVAGETAQIWIDVNAIENTVGGTLGEGDRAVAVLMPQVGIETRAALLVPTALGDRKVIEL